MTTPNPNTADKRFTVATPEVSAICSTQSLLLEAETVNTPSAGGHYRHPVDAGDRCPCQERDRSWLVEEAPDIQTTGANFSETDLNCFRKLQPSLTSQLRLQIGERLHCISNPRRREGEKKQRGRLDFTLPANLSWISVVVSKMQMKAIREPLAILCQLNVNVCGAH